MRACRWLGGKEEREKQEMIEKETVTEKERKEKKGTGPVTDPL